MASKEDVLQDLERAVAEVTGVEEVKRRAEEALRLNADPLEIVESVRKGLDEVGRRYEKGEYFLMELILSGVMASEVSGLLKPYFTARGSRAVGKVVIGTVEGDLHDIGKNIVITMLSSSGFEVVDLGVDVPVERFVEAVGREKPDILAMSVLLSLGMPRMADVIKRLEEEGLRKGVKVMVGGRPVTADYARQIGADAYGADAVEAMRFAQVWMAERRGEERESREER